MKIAIPVDSMQGIGGGFTFQRNLIKGLQLIGETVVTNPLEADIVLISSVTMINKETFQRIKEFNKKVVVRLDNVPRNSRNRNTGTSRMKSYCEKADQIIWQSEWAKFYLEDFIGKEGKIIYNGVDLNIFNPDGKTTEFDLNVPKDNFYLYSRFSRDETKHWETAWYEYQLIQRQNKLAKLIIVGKFAPENIEWDFDFFRGESYVFLGIIIDSEKMAKLYRSCGWLMAPYFNDAFSNTYLEALCTGVKLYKPDMSGGTPEMIKLFNEKGREYFSLERMDKDYLKVFHEVLQK